MSRNVRGFKDGVELLEPDKVRYDCFYNLSLMMPPNLAKVAVQDITSWTFS